jgi:hypothetical protein
MKTKDENNKYIACRWNFALAGIVAKNKSGKQILVPFLTAKSLYNAQQNQRHPTEQTTTDCERPYKERKLMQKITNYIFAICLGISVFLNIYRFDKVNARLNELKAASTTAQQPRERHYFKYMKYHMLDIPEIKATPDSAFFEFRNDSLFVYIIK